MNKLLSNKLGAGAPWGRTIGREKTHRIYDLVEAHPAPLREIRHALAAGVSISVSEETIGVRVTPKREEL